MDIDNLISIAKYASYGWSAISFIGIAVVIIRGLLKPAFRLGVGVSLREIAVFTKSDEDYRDLHKVLAESGLFKEKNIKYIHKNHLREAEEYTFFLVHWKDWDSEDSKKTFEQIMQYKKNTTNMVVYAPHRDGKIPDDLLPKINELPHTIVVNFRGRLLNDILTAMMTTPYSKGLVTRLGGGFN